MKEPKIVMIVSYYDDNPIALTFGETEHNAFLHKRDYFSSHGYRCNVYIEKNGVLEFNPEESRL